MRRAFVRLDKQQGGLGIRDLTILNEALLGKWSWRFASERDPLWKWVIVGKYGQVEGGWCSKVVGEGHGVGVWKAIKGKWEMFKTRTKFTVGFGNRVKFWKDKWCGDSSLRESFLKLYSIASSKDACVSDLREDGG